MVGKLYGPRVQQCWKRGRASALRLRDIPLCVAMYVWYILLRIQSTNYLFAKAPFAGHQPHLQCRYLPVHAHFALGNMLGFSLANYSVVVHMHMHSFPHSLLLSKVHLGPKVLLR